MKACRACRTVTSERAKGAGAYLNDRGQRLLRTLDDVAAAHDTSVAAVSLAWLSAQPTVAAPIASARTVDQLAELLPAATLTLTGEELRRIEEVSRPS